MSFSTQLKEEIEFADLRYKELAEKSGVPERALYNYVATKNPSMPPADVAVRIAKVLGVSVEYLVTGEKNFDSQYFVHYPAEIRNLADKIAKMTLRDRRHVTALVNAIASD